MSSKHSRARGAAVIGAMGVVYGDIGTSPLYALEASLKAAGGVEQGPAALLGVLSLIFWSLLIVVTLKYVLLVMRADNEGEGGILSLYSLVQRQLGEVSRWAQITAALAVLGAALYYCDAMITPAITVLGAVEGMELLNADAVHFVVPASLLIVVFLFSLQRRGTEKIGRLFGPVMLVWFGALAVSGLLRIVAAPQVLAALNPYHGVRLLATHPLLALTIQGGVFLAVTGAEALYADMGHFGRKPVTVAWLTMVWPSLVLSYFGQGASILLQPEAAHKPLFTLFSPVLLPWFVLLATAAAIIASQATISSAFSMTRQAIQLDLLPRLRILQTSAAAHGQIFVPIVSRLLAVAVCLVVLGFGSSDAVGAAYGAAVAGTMMITGILGATLARLLWKWPLWLVLAVFGVFAINDVVFVVSNLTKFMAGAWVPLAMAAILYMVFMTWRSGRQLLRKALRQQAVPLGELPRRLESVTRVPGTAVFLVSDPNYIPAAMLRNLEHNHVVHERNVFLNIEIVRAPRQDAADRVRVTDLAHGITRVTARFGFMETPDVSEALKQCRGRGLRIFAQDSSFFVGWHLVRPRPRAGIEGVRRNIFAWMQRRSAQAAEFFRMPERRVIVLATQVEM